MKDYYWAADLGELIDDKVKAYMIDLFKEDKCDVDCLHEEYWVKANYRDNGWSLDQDWFVFSFDFPGPGEGESKVGQEV